MGIVEFFGHFIKGCGLFLCFLTLGILIQIPVGVAIFLALMGALIITVHFATKEEITQNKEKEEDDISISFKVTTPEDERENSSYSQEFIFEQIKKMAINNNPNTTNLNSPINYFSDSWNIKLSFNESKSVSFREVLSLIKQHPSFSCVIDSDTTIQRYEVSFNKNELKDFKIIYDLVKSWKSTRVYIYGELIEKNKLSKLLRCCMDKPNLENRDFCYGISPYTYNPFGCHRISVRGMISGICDRAWYNFAEWKDGKVIINKEKIIETIKLDLQDYKYCPFIDLREIWSNIVNLPNEISLWDKNFIIIQTMDNRIEVKNRWIDMYGSPISYQQLKNIYGKNLLSKQ